MQNSFDNVTETIRINKERVSIKTVRMGGKEGDFYVFICESLNVSGYGSTRQEADESFKENMKLFCIDLLELSHEQREQELRKLGFQQQKYHNKNFSKTYVDGNGELQNFEAGTVEKSILETVI